MRFDGFQPAYDYSEMTGIFSGAWQHRRSNLYNRVQEDPNDTTTNPGYLFSSATGDIGGKTADTTAIVRQEAAQATGAIDAWGWDWYHEETLITDPNDYNVDATLHPNAIQVSKLNRGLKAYVAAADITAPKFWTMILADDLGLGFPNNTYKYVVSFCSYVDSLMNDPRWMRTKAGGYYLGFFNAAAIDSTHYSQCLAQFTHSPLYIVFDGGSSSGSPLTHNTLFWYGVQDLPAGAGQHAYVDLEAQDKTRWTSTNAGTMNWLTDRRPFQVDTWVDQPTQVEALRHITDAINSSAGTNFGVFTIWNELAEEGPGALQTAQEGTRYTDALKWARVPTSKPLSYTYELSLSSLYVTRTGTGWANQQPGPTGILGAHDSDEISSSTTNDSISLTHQAVTQFGLRASTGPDRGIVEVDVDGSFVANVDLYSASAVVHQLVWQSSTLTNASHTVKFVVTGTKNAASSSVNTQIDSVQVTYHP